MEMDNLGSITDDGMKTLDLEDNSPNKLFEDSSGYDEIISRISKVRITKKYLEENRQLIVFPYSFMDTEFYSEHKERENDNKILDYYVEDKRNVVKTYNIMGFIGLDGCYINIHSRFDGRGDEQSKKKYTDNLLYYMLMRVCGINLSGYKQSDSSGREGIHNILMLFFQMTLREAMRQGVFKKYVTLKCNDLKVKGVIDVNRYIREDIPFKGKIAYNSRVHSTDNDVIQLIRHTIEYMKSTQMGRIILNGNSELKKDVRVIIDATPSYNKNERKKILRNVKYVSHPYFTKYKVLQQLCVSILNNDKLGENAKEGMHGILFDGSWLWEEFLASVFAGQNVIHSNNKRKLNGLELFSGKPNRTVYPDFYQEPHSAGEDGIVIDAKYKTYAITDEKGRAKRGVDTGDIYQIMAYMMRLHVKNGILVCPAGSGEVFESPYTMHENSYTGEEGKISVVGFPISQESKFEEFKTVMDGYSDTFWKKYIKKGEE